MLTRRARTATAPKRAHRSRHPYIFKSLVFCGICERKMQGQHSHGVAYYRCRYPQEYALANHIEHPRNVIMREEILIPPLDTWLVQELSPSQRHHTIAKLVDQATVAAPTAPITAPTGPTVAECDAKLARYRAALDAGADPAVVAGWIADTQTERHQAEQRQQAATTEPPPEHGRFTEEEIIAIVEELGDLVAALRQAEPEHKLEVYRALGLRLTYLPDTQTVRAQVDLATHRWDSVCVRGGT
jgi:site-specific DNA recombinase